MQTFKGITCPSGWRYIVMSQGSLLKHSNLMSADRTVSYVGSGGRSRLRCAATCNHQQRKQHESEGDCNLMSHTTPYNPASGGSIAEGLIRP